MYEIKNFPAKRVLLLTMSGTVTIADLTAMTMKMGQACATYRGGKFAMIADMRGLLPLAPEAAEAFKQGIVMGRQNGVAVCAHLSSSGIIRLQANRLSREASVGDANVIDVVSIEEAWRVATERQAELI